MTAAAPNPLRTVLRLMARLFPGEDKRQTMALLTLGYLAGLVMGVGLLSARLDRVSLEREQYLVRCADLAVQIEKLQERLDLARSAQGGPIVGEVSLNLEGADELTRLRVRSAVSGLVDDIVGENVTTLDPALVLHLLDGRMVVVEKRTIVLRVETVVIGPETAFWVRLEVLPERPPESGE